MLWVLKWTISMSTLNMCKPEHVYKVNSVLNDHSNLDKTKVLKTGGSLMQVDSILECSPGAFCNTFNLH